MKDIKDYLHLYIGCTLKSKTGTVRLMSVIAEINPNTNWGIAVLNGNQSYTTEVGEYLPVLRPLSDMKQEDIKDWDDNISITHTVYAVEVDSKNDFGEFTEIYPDGSILSKSKDDGDIRPINGGELFRILLSKGFDLFNLISEGLAIDSTTLNQLK